jgi:uncharacterized protein (TIGR03435 family)
VKQDTAVPSAQTMHSNIPLGNQGFFSPTGGLLSSTNCPLLQYIIFAYKLAHQQVQSAPPQLPKWATTDRYDIQARGAGNPTLDQFRLMMQALLADRFKLALHFETRQLPVFGLVLDKPGKLGARIQPHPNDSACSAVPSASVTTVAGGFPEMCDELVGFPSPSVPGQMRLGARNMSMEMIATSFGSVQMFNMDRPVLDKTGLTGTFDFFMEFTPQLNGPLPPGSPYQLDPNGPTFLEALKGQLGLKLQPQTGPMDVLVIHHIEQPSEN